MKLFTAAQMARLKKNGQDWDADHFPVVKLFNPMGAATWLLSQVDPENEDLAYGLCDLGFGCVELGYVSLRELSEVRLPLGLGIERDLYFSTDQTLSEHYEISSEAGRITV